VLTFLTLLSDIAEEHDLASTDAAKLAEGNAEDSRVAAIDISENEVTAPTRATPYGKWPMCGRIN
jgi:hypothetical protein